VLERKAPPTFNVLIEIVDRNELAIYRNVGEVVDAFLRGYAPQPEIRRRTSGGEVAVVQEQSSQELSAALRVPAPNASGTDDAEEQEATLLIFPYGVSRNKIERAIHNLCVNASIARKWDEADIVLTLKTLERKESAKLTSIAAENVPIYSIKTNTVTQIQGALKDIFNLGSIDAEEIALREAGEAIYQVLLENKVVELSPQSSYVRRMQHQLAEQHRVHSRSTGLEPNRRVLIYRDPEFPQGTPSV
jgi:hypothetical protein